ncbi:PAS domain S-box protein [Rossellomorea aquimaris]|uniref:Histidine kinase n=1 Tax=Rossellomorea aquimaris TaxID=189382 RepID=A0A1J6WTC2_9BACI|nr:PAS domain S-box protein [Rossellomorea aquimaris]OIU71467.1 histidine kinase [Rossellomorea aquimaris]
MSEDLSEIDYLKVMEYSLDPLIIHTDYRIMYVNDAAEEFFRTDKEGVVGQSPLDIFRDSSKDAIRKRIQSAYGSPADVIEETIYRTDGTTVEVELYCHPLMIGDTQAIQTYVYDITEKKEREKKQSEMAAEINELSAVLVPLLDDIAVLPIVGTIDEEKARWLLEIIPAKVRKQNVNHVIIDFSGVYTLNPFVTDALFKITSVLALLGVRSIITGLRPEMVTSALNQNIDLSLMPTLATVKDALAYMHVDVQ